MTGIKIAENCHESRASLEDTAKKIADPHGMIFEEKQYITLSLA
jgi:hypothetical protein